MISCSIKDTCIHHFFANQPFHFLRVNAYTCLKSIQPCRRRYLLPYVVTVFRILRLRTHGFLELNFMPCSFVVITEISQMGFYSHLSFWLTTSSWWSTGEPLPIKCLTTSRWPSAAALWSAVCPVWKNKRNVVSLYAILMIMNAMNITNHKFCL